MKTIPRWARPPAILCIAAIAGAAPAEERPAAPPQTLVELTYDFGEDVAFESYSVNVTLHHDIENGAHLLIAPAADVIINGTALTAGVVTDAGGYHFKHQRERENNIGKAIGLWMPGSTNIVLAQAKEGALFDRGDEANPYIAVLGPTDWQKGTYTLFVRKQSERTLDGQKYTWIEASLYSHKSGRETYSGSIRFDGSEFTLGGTVGARIAIAAGKTVPTAKISMGGWKLNDEPTIPLSAQLRFPEGAPPHASCKMVAKDVVVVLGPEVKHRKNRKLTKSAEGYEQTLFSRKSRPAK